MGKIIDHIYNYEQQNWPYPYPSTNFFIPPGLYTSIQTQHKGAYDASVGANDVSSDVIYQSINHNFNTDVNNNDDSH